jgi:hypothetical protein
VKQHPTQEDIDRVRSRVEGRKKSDLLHIDEPTTVLDEDTSPTEEPAAHEQPQRKSISGFNRFHQERKAALLSENPDLT